MKVKGSKSPQGGGTTGPLDPRKSVGGADFARALARLESQAGAEGAARPGGAAEATRSALSDIARGADLTNDEDTKRAVRESARLLIHSRLGPEHRETEQGAGLVEGLSEYVADDPFLKNKLLTILKKLKAS